MKSAAAICPTIADYRRQAPDAGRLVGGRAGGAGTPARGDGVVSVITVSFNSVATIERTIDSVRAQTYSPVEYIVVDGGSRDGTVDTLRRRAGDIDLWISERDRGIADAFNKGIALANGEYIAIVNSDDWLEPEQLRIAVAELDRSGADFVFGNMVLHAPDGAPAHMLLGDPHYVARLAHSMPHLNHPTVVCRRRTYDSFGLFDLSLKVALDYEWFCRIHARGARGIYTPRLVGHMSLQGASDRGAEIGLAEVRAISIRYGHPALLAWVRFVTRVVKVRARQLLEQCLPPGLYERLRGRINTHYRSVSAPAKLVIDDGEKSR